MFKICIIICVSFINSTMYFCCFSNLALNWFFIEFFSLVSFATKAIVLFQISRWDCIYWVAMNTDCSSFDRILLSPKFTFIEFTQNKLTTAELMMSESNVCFHNFFLLSFCTWKFFSAASDSHTPLDEEKLFFLLHFVSTMKFFTFLCGEKSHFFLYLFGQKANWIVHIKNVTWIFNCFADEFFDSFSRFGRLHFISLFLLFRMFSDLF